MLLHVNVNVNFNLKVNVSRSRSHSMSLTAIQWQPSNVNDKNALLLFVHPQHHVVCSIVTSVMQNGFPPKNNFWIQTGVWAGSFQDFPGARFHWVNMCRIIFALLLGRGEMQYIHHYFIVSLVGDVRSVLYKWIEIPGKCYLHITWKFQICPRHESSLHRCCRVFRTLHTRQGFCDALLRF